MVIQRPSTIATPSELTQTSIDVDKLSMLLSQAHAVGLIKTTEQDNTLVQSGAAPTAAATTKAKNAAMEKYLKIARQLVKLQGSLPSLKLCMADV